MGKSKVQQVSNVDENDLKKNSTKSRYSLTCNHNEDSEYPFMIIGLDVGSFEMKGFEVKDNSNWVYPHALKVKGGTLSLTDYELVQLMVAYMRIVVSIPMTYESSDTKCVSSLTFCKK